MKHSDLPKYGDSIVNFILVSKRSSLLLLTILCMDLCCGLFTDKWCFVCLFVADKLLESNDSMHRLMQEKGQLIATLLQIPYDDYESVAEVCVMQTITAGCSNVLDWKISEQEAKVIWRRLHWIPLHLTVDPDPCLMQCSLGPHKCSPETASWSVQPFLHSEARVEPRDGLTDRQTPGWSVTIVCISCVWCSLIIALWTQYGRG